MLHYNVLGADLSAFLAPMEGSTVSVQQPSTTSQTQEDSSSPEEWAEASNNLFIIVYHYIAEFISPVLEFVQLSDPLFFGMLALCVMAHLAIDVTTMAIKRDWIPAVFRYPFQGTSLH